MFMDGFYQKAFVPVLLPEFKTDVVQVAAGYEHMCILLSNGEVQCWGNNQVGQLGLGHQTPAYYPISVELPSSASKIFVGFRSSCALLTTGQLYCWGDNSSGKLGLGHENSAFLPELVPVSNVSSVIMSNSHSCLLQAGNVLCAGSNSFLQLGVDNITSSNTFVSNGVSSVVDIDISDGHSCAVLNDGSVKCWGNGSSGQLGDGYNNLSSLPVTVSGINTATEVSTSNIASCARLSSGEASCWGNNGQLTLGSEGESSNVPQLVPGLSNVLHIESGAVEFCAQHATNEVTCWGRGAMGLLGDGGSARPRVNASVDFSFTKTYRSFQSIALGVNWMFGVFPDGIVRATGSNGNRQLGLGEDGPLSQNNSSSYFIDSTALAPSTLIQSGYRHGCSTKVNGGIECWGRNNFGQSGDPSLVDPLYVPFEVYPSGIVLKIQPMWDANCALLLNGTVECWGNNNEGQLGDGGILTLSAVPQAVPNVTDIVDLNCSKFSTSCCATKRLGGKQCWGYNNAGQLGHEPTSMFELSPVDVEWGSDAVSTTTGAYHTCYVNSVGKVFCFGGNFYGMLGDGTLVNSTPPREISLPTGAIEVKAGFTHTCALLQDSRLFCWGDNYYSTIGVGNTPGAVLKPVQVMEDVIEFDLGYVFSCALDSSRLLWCWGDNTRGNFGNGQNSVFPFPTPIGYKK